MAFNQTLHTLRTIPQKQLRHVKVVCIFHNLDCTTAVQYVMVSRSGDTSLVSQFNRPALSTRIALHRFTDGLITVKQFLPKQSTVSTYLISDYEPPIVAGSCRVTVGSLLSKYVSQFEHFNKELKVQPLTTNRTNYQKGRVTYLAT